MSVVERPASVVLVALVEEDVISTVVKILVVLGLGLHGPASEPASKSAAIKAVMIVLTVIFDSNDRTEKLREKNSNE